MSYTPPDRHALSLRISGVYTPPDRHTLRLPIAPVTAAASTAQAQSADAIGRVVVPAIASSTQAQSADAIGRVVVTRRVLAAQSRARWQVGQRRDHQSALPWSNGVPIDDQRSIRLSHGEALAVSLDLSWAVSASIASDRQISLGKASPFATQRGLPWYTPAAHDQQTSDRWQRAAVRDGEVHALRWRNPPRHDQQRQLRWQVALPRDHQVWLASGKASAVDTQRRLPWGAANAVPWAYLLVAPPPPAVAPPLGCYQPPARHALRLRLGSRGLLYLPPDRHQLALGLRCDHNRRFDLRETLHMSHSLSVVRLPDRLPLAVRSVSLGADRDSWAWSVQLGFADAASLIAVEPTPTGLASVEITLDGHVFTAQVEGYTEDRSFAKRGGNVSGRSRTVQLAAPNVPERAYTNPAPATAQQLALRELEFTDFSLDWQIDDWPVPAGAWAYDRETPISAITRIAAAAGAMLQSGTGTDTLIVAPRLPALPWAIEAETVDFTLAGGSWLSKGKRWNGGGRYNGVYVSGREQGVLANVYRDGTSGSPYAQLVIDPLITSSVPARGRGGQILADSLPRHEIPIVLPLTPFGSAPGLLLPGELGQIQDTVWGDYRAVVDSVQITAEVSAEGLVTTRQSASLWRYLP